MATERIQRRIDLLLDEADQAVANSEWELVLDRAKNVLAFDPENQDALARLWMLDFDDLSPHVRHNGASRRRGNPVGYLQNLQPL